MVTKQSNYEDCSLHFYLVNMPAPSILLPIYYLKLLSLVGSAGLLVLTSSGQQVRGGVTLDRLPVHHRAFTSSLKSLI